jgi:hypothetical protein
MFSITSPEKVCFYDSDETFPALLAHAAEITLDVRRNHTRLLEGLQLEIMA